MSQQRKQIRAKNWVFTLNNYTEEDENRLKQMECIWLIYGHETAPETGTQHIQGAICFKGRRDFNALQKLFKWHIEIMRGTPQDSKTYCTKEDSNYFEKGEMPLSGGQKTKENWEEIYNAAIEGKFEDIPRKIWIRYKHNLVECYTDNLHDPDMQEVNDTTIKKHFLWLHGPTGTGKSHTARRISSELGCEDPYLKDLNKWWNGYLYQKVTIIEEAEPKKCEHLASFFKKWCDKWSFTAECKGSVIQKCRPEYIIVTSNFNIQECFPLEADWIPLKRRFTEIEVKNRTDYVYWPKSQAELELEAATKEQTEMRHEVDAYPGNTTPGRQEPHDVSELSPTQTYEIDSPSLEEYEEQISKKRKVE